MNRCEEIKAFEKVSRETGLSSHLYENSSKENANSIYIEFHDEYDRDGGAFFSSMLYKLGIDQCEAG